MSLKIGAIKIILLSIIFSGSRANVQDALDNVLTDGETSILNLGERHDLLEGVVGCCSRRFAGIRLDVGHDNLTDTLQMLDILNITKPNRSDGSASASNIHLAIDVTYNSWFGDTHLTALAHIVDKGRMFRSISQVAMKIPTICVQIPSRQMQHILETVSKNMDHIRKMVKSYSNSSASVGIAPSGFSEDEYCYHSTTTLFRDILAYDFIVVPVTMEYENIVYGYEDFANFLDRKLGDARRRIFLINAKLEITLSFWVDFGDNKELSKRGKVMANQMMSNFTYRYGKEKKIRVEYSVLMYYNQTDTFARKIGSDQFGKALKLNRELVYKHVGYEQLKTYLSVIARDFTTILIEGPGIRDDLSGEKVIGSNWNQFLIDLNHQRRASLQELHGFENRFVENVNNFNEERMKTNGSQIGIIVRLNYVATVRDLKNHLLNLNDTAGKFPGLISGVVLTHTSFEVCRGLFQSRENVSSIFSNESNMDVPILGVDCPLEEIPKKDETTTLWEGSLSSKSRYCVYQPLTTFITIADALKHLRNLENMKASLEYPCLWVEFQWDSGNLRRGQGCWIFNKFYEILRNWALIHDVNVIVSNAFDVMHGISTGWYKNVAYEDWYKILDSAPDSFVAKVKDPCVRFNDGPIQRRIRFNSSLSAVALNVSESSIGVNDFVVLVQMTTTRFQRIELTATDFKEASKLIAIIEDFQQENGSTIPLEIYIRFSTTNFTATRNIKLKKLKQVETELKTIFSGTRLTRIVGIHLDGEGDLQNCEENVTPSQNLLLSTLKKLNHNVPIGVTLKLSESTSSSYCTPKFLNKLSYILLHVDVNEFVAPRGCISTNFKHQIESNDLRHFVRIFDKIRAFHLNIRKIKPALDIKLRFQWPLPSLNSGDVSRSELVVGNMLRFWSYVNEFCSTFNFSYIINSALEEERGGDDERKAHLEVDNVFDRIRKDVAVSVAGWWWVNKNLSDFSSYVEKESHLLQVETPKPVKVLILPDRWSENNLNLNKNKDDILLNIVGAVLVLSFLLVIIIALAVGLHRRNLILSKDEVRKFVDGLRENVTEGSTGEAEILGLPYNSNLEIGKEEFSSSKSKIIGSGNFGIVYKADIPRFKDPVAVKVAQNNGNSAEWEGAFRSLLSEIKIMSCVDEDVNVVKILGAYTKEIQKGIAFVVIEFCEVGSLQSYLRSVAKTLDPEEDQLKKVDVHELQGFSMEIASGMEYIASKNLIHGDLSTRNVLLSNCNICKICDFGLAKKLDAYGKYVKGQQELLPWRWMALESLKKKEFTVKSDVWSFGVTLWEIFNLGDVPYANMTWSEEFIQNLENGMRLTCPKFADDIMYDIQSRCSELDPEKRPTFTELKVAFRQLRNTEYIMLEE